MSERHVLLFHAHLQYLTQNGMALVQTVKKGYQWNFVFFRLFFVSLLCLPTRFFGVDLCLCC